MAIHEDVDVRPEPWAGLDESVADTGRAQLERADDRVDGVAVEIVAPLYAWEQGQQRPRQQDRSHGGQS
ncbi:MAG TPA: hypothetical protein VG370_18535 [Chloroflexota bacterium]|nr:hypothetical protein [Chloroflexota bacterium]